MKFDKLVRDKIPQIIHKKGQKAITHIANNNEYWQKLKEKLAEEVKEFTDNASIEELADILEVLEAISKFKKFSQSKILLTKRQKAYQRGKFNKRIILETTKK